jgi:hypothetical protein
MRIHSGTRDCRFKSKISSRKRALSAAARLTHRLGEDIQAYRCGPCHAWHIGHKERYREREHRYLAKREAS